MHRRTHTRTHTHSAQKTHRQLSLPFITHLLQRSAREIDDIQQAIIQKGIGGHGQHAGDLPIVGSGDVQEGHSL